MRVEGFVAPGFEPVAAAFHKNLMARGDTGAAFAAIVGGEPVADLWGGWAAVGRPWQPDTVAGIFSGSKGLVAACLLLLLDRGRLDLERPIADYWPEFAAQGKEAIRVRHVVSHQAGLPGLLTPVTAAEATNDRRMAALVANQPAICPPGTRLHYHALTFGWLCGELIRRIDGRSVGQLFAEEIARPLGLDAWIGLPAEHDDRVALFRRDPSFGTRRSPVDGAGACQRLPWSIWENPPRFSEPLPGNTREWRAAEVPASNGIGSARSLARLYACLARGGEIDGIRLLSPETVGLGRRLLARGQEPLLGRPFAFGIGFQLQDEGSPFGPAADGFGHPGAGGSVHGAWPGLRTGFSYVTSMLRDSEMADPRAEALLEALYASLMQAGVTAARRTGAQ